MRLGRLLAGAGDVGRGWRQTEEDIRVAHNNQLDIEARNRLEALRRIQTRQQMANAPNFSNLLTEGVRRDVRGVPFAGEVAGVAPGTLGQGVDSEKAGTASETTTANGPRREAGATELPSRWSTTSMPDRFPNYQDNYYDHYFDPNVGPATNLGRSARNSIGAGVATGLRVMDLASQHPALGPVRAARDIVGLVANHAGEIAETGAAFVGLEGSPRSETTTTRSAPGSTEAPTTERSAEEVAADRANVSAKESASTGIRSGARGAEDAQRYSAEDFYRANPQEITLRMQQTMQNRESAVRLAQMYQQAGLGEQYTNARLAVEQMDQQMYLLHGRQAVYELNRFDDPRRLEAVWSYYAGVPMEIHPRADGTYDIMVQGRPLRGAQGLSGEEISDLAQRDFDESYREQVNAIEEERSMLSFESDLRVRENTANQNAQMTREVIVARTRSQLEQITAQATANGWTPHRGDNGTWVFVSPDGSQARFVDTSQMFDPAEEGELAPSPVRTLDFGAAVRNAGLTPQNGQ